MLVNISYSFSFGLFGKKSLANTDTSAFRFQYITSPDNGQRKEGKRGQGLILDI